MLLARDSARPTKNDGLGAIRFVVKGLVVLSFLVLVTGINYASTGELPALWSDGDVATISSDVAMNFYRRNLRSQDSNCTAATLKVQVDKCAFVRAECPADGFIDYLDFYYCTARNPAGWILLVFLLLLYFYLLGGTAERFFCPALCRLSSGLRMSPNVAGVTLLALGNGSPDIFSTIASVQQDALGQALGSLLGAGMFVTSVVVGSVTIAAKGALPKVTRRPFLRDLGFYLATLIVIFFICWDGKIHLWESILFIGIYVIYVATVIIGRFIYQRRKKAAAKKAQMVITVNQDADEFEFVGTGQDGKSYDDYDDDDGIGAPARNTANLLQADSTFNGAAPSERKKTKTTIRERMAKRMAALGVYVSKIGFWRNKTKRELKREVRMTMARAQTIHGGDAGPTSMRLTHRPAASMRQTVQRISDIADVSETDDDGVISSGTEMSDDGSRPTERAAVGWGLSSIVHQQLLSINNDIPESEADDELIEDDALPVMEEEAAPLLDDSENYEEPDYSWEDNIDASTCAGATKINWRNLKEISELDEVTTLRSSIIFFVDLPRLLLQHLTIHYAEPDTYSRILYVLQPVGIASLLLTLMKAWTLHTALPGPLSAWIMPLALILSVVIYFTTKNEEPPIYEWVFIVSGLFMSVVWIYYVAQELVALLGAAGTILGISNAIMGLTVLAWGNSIGDMVSNVVVSRKGFPQMALSACYAAPLSNMLLGLGISLTIRIVRLRSTFFSLDEHLSNTVFWGFIFLIGTLIASLITVPVAKFTYYKIFGIVLIFVYFIFTGISLLSEFNIIFKNFVIWDKWPGRQ